MKLAISQIVLERVEFRHPDDYFNQSPKTQVPESGVKLFAQVMRANKDPNRGAMVRLNAKSEDDATYQFDVTFAVFYGIEWDEGEEVPDNLDQQLMVTGSIMLMPFVRELVASLTGRGRFGTTWLAPTSLNALVPIMTPEPEGVGSGG